MNRKAAGFGLVGLAAVILAFGVFFMLNSDLGLCVGDLDHRVFCLNTKVLLDYASISGTIGMILGGLGGWMLVSHHRASQKD